MAKDAFAALLNILIVSTLSLSGGSLDNLYGAFCPMLFLYATNIAKLVHIVLIRCVLAHVGDFFH